MKTVTIDRSLNVNIKAMQVFSPLQKTTKNKKDCGEKVYIRNVHRYANNGTADLVARTKKKYKKDKKKTKKDKKTAVKRFLSEQCPPLH